jgi:hypothetical protein
MECECCGHIGKVTVRNLRVFGGEGRDIQLCKVCYDSGICSLMQYTSHAEHAIILRAIAQCTNMILDAIKKK